MDSIRTCISFLSGKAAQSIARLSRERLSPFGLTPIQFAVLQALSERERATAADIGAFLVIDSATIVGVIDRLSASGLVRREPDEVDRRLHRLALTEKAAEVLPVAVDAMDALNAEIDDALGEASQAIRTQLTQLANLNNRPPNIPHV